MLIAQWTAEFENDPTLGIMEECYTNLKSKSTTFFLYIYIDSVLMLYYQISNSKHPKNLRLPPLTMRSVAKKKRSCSGYSRCLYKTRAAVDNGRDTQLLPLQAAQERRAPALISVVVLLQPPQLSQLHLCLALKTHLLRQPTSRAMFPLARHPPSLRLPFPQCRHLRLHPLRRHL